jgi:L-lactate dehydrogenase complex protein LldF
MMPDTFHWHIEKALSDQNLQSALDTNAENRLRARISAFSSLPEDWLVLRQRAHERREEVISHLNEYLGLFISRAESNGIIVHRANHASEAVAIVLDIAKQNHVQHVAKSKTMVSEEIGLNHSLEAHGMHVVETDLGEYIIQLRAEPPAHIITPAVHLKREQVGMTFKEKLGVPYTDDIATMTGIARRELRQVFLNADMGISGVNFGVAETGTLCLVTNEGNGRMVTTLPPVHVALMGIERIVPSMKDLALMLALLPRSATGQKLTVYVSLINGPRKPQDVDGPRERHLVLVDNGRLALQSSPLAESLLCIRCGACLNACPVFREIGGHAYVNSQGTPSTYPGPIGSVISQGLFGQSEFGQLARASSLCGACKDACPVAIDLPKLLLRVRAGKGAQLSKKSEAGIPFSIRSGINIFAWIAAHPKIFSFSQRFAGLVSRGINPDSEWLHMPAFTGWGISKDIPKPSQHPFRDWWAQRSAKEEISIYHNTADNKAVNSDNQQFYDTRTIDSDLVKRFSDELKSLNGNFQLVEYIKDSDTQIQNLGEIIVSLLREKDIHSIISWNREQLPAGLVDYLSEQGIQIVFEGDPNIRAGLTSALAGVSETGSIVLQSGNGRSQVASLLPEIHIAVLKASDVYETIESVLQIEEIRKSNVINIVSGPSRTADIEMTLTLGVHGPREVYVFCLGEAEATK